jgi:8-oxo-dGTP pyrophosphatase MutT (NUDIX family)
MDTSHFSAGFIFKKFGSVWYTLIVRDKRFSDLKAAGGMWAEGENPLDTLYREFRQELGVEVRKAIHVHEVKKVNHIQHFFLVTDVTGLPELDEKRELKEIKGGRIGDVLEVSWVTMKEFSQRIYHGQIPAFAKAIAEMATPSQEFCDDNVGLLRQFEHLM